MEKFSFRDKAENRSHASSDVHQKSSEALTSKLSRLIGLIQDSSSENEVEGDDGFRVSSRKRTGMSFSSTNPDETSFFQYGRPKVVLETWSAKHLRTIFHLWLVCAFLSLIISIIFIILINTLQVEYVQYSIGPAPDDVRQIKEVNVDGSALVWAEIGFRIVSFLVMIVLLSFFIYRYLRTDREIRLSAQIFLMALIVSLLVLLVPFKPAIQLVIGNNEKDFLEFGIAEFGAGTRTGLLVIYGIQHATFGSVLSIYLWGKSHSLRGAFVSRSVWTPRIFCSLLFLFRLSVVLGTRTFLPALPFVGFLAFIQMLRIGVGHLGASPSQIIMLTLLTLYEAGILIAIFFDFRTCKKSLQNSSYLGTRSIRVLFYFFKANVYQYVIVTFLVVCIELFGIPLEWQSVLFQITGILYLDSWQAPMSLVVSVVFVFSECITMFPANSQPMPYCWKETEQNESTRRMAFRRFERVSKEGKTEHMSSRLMILETQLLLMNFCMLSYQYGNPTPPMTFEDMRVDPKYRFHEHIADVITDTHLIVLESDDRIVVCFRGTKSMDNILTDLKTRSIKLSWALNDDRNKDSGLASDGREAFEQAVDLTPAVVQQAINVIESQEVDLSRDYKRARVHFGFAEAYRSISQRMLISVLGLYQTQKRVIYTTGHSLGGALATLASYHLSIVLDLDNPEEIVCVTCGSPRVGNSFFADLYNRSVSNSWRLVVSGDPIPKIPKGRYSHIGILTLLFFDGELMIDPTFIEELNHERGSSTLAFHRMWSYRLVIQRWCELYSNDFDPDLWNFGDTPSDIVKLFGSTSLEKKQHAELMKLQLIRDSVQEHTRERFRMSQLKHRKITPEITAAWKTLTETITHEVLSV